MSLHAFPGLERTKGGSPTEGCPTYNKIAQLFNDKKFKLREAKSFQLEPMTIRGRLIENHERKLEFLHYVVGVAKDNGFEGDDTIDDLKRTFTQKIQG